LSSINQSPSNVQLWRNLINFGPSILAKPKRGGNKRNISKLISCRIKEWNTSESVNTFNDRITSQTRYIHQCKDDRKLLASAVASKLEEGNFKAAIRLICSDDKPAQINKLTHQALKAKHPSVPPDRRSQCAPSSSNRFAPLQITIGDLMSAVRTFPPGSSGGPNGVSPQHIKDMLATEGI